MPGAKYSEIVTHGVAGDIHPGKVSMLSASALEMLPRTSWWKLFIDKRYHGAASPALLFDREASKGFHAVMMRVFKAELRLEHTLGRRLDFVEYERLYGAVSVNVGGISNRGRSGTDSPVGPTNFPPIYTPGPAALNELLAENVGYWDIPANIKRFDKMNKVSLMRFGVPASWRFSVQYKMADVPALADRFFKRYYTEIADAGGGALAQANAIVKLVRALHVYHFFRDANGRLNTMVVLNKLLLENGFPPAIVSDPAIFGGGRTIAELVGDVHAGMKIVLIEMEAHVRMAALDLAT